jgi:protein-disulfide isomerase
VPVLRRGVPRAPQAGRRRVPVFTKHPYALTAALAAEASGEHFWAMHDLLFTHQTRLTDPDLVAYATEAGVPDPESVVGDAAQRFRPAVEADYTTGVSDGARGTPTLFVDGRLYEGRIELGALRSTLGLGR